MMTPEQISSGQAKSGSQFMVHNTGLMYNLIDFSSNIQATSAIDGQFIVLASLTLPFQ